MRLSPVDYLQYKHWCRTDCFGLLHFPVFRHYFCPHDPALLAILNILSTILSWNEAPGFSDEIRVVWVIFWYVWVCLHLSLLMVLFAETLTGLATIRSYGRQVIDSHLSHWVSLKLLQSEAITSAEHGLDLENRAYYMTITLQRWLGVRLDLLGSVLILGICLFAAGLRFQVNPSKIGMNSMHFTCWLDYNWLW